MQLKKITWLFLGIIALAVFARLIYLGKTPISLEWDEVAIGYDAYSILKTGKDQFGQFLPLTFRSLDDYKPPLYLYATVPSVAIFGLNEFGTRLPAAVSGIFAVVLTYYLVLEIFRNHEKKHLLALISALFLAVSPWHLQFSRAAFETNLSVTVTIGAVLLFYKGLRVEKYFILSAILFGIALFSYHSTRVVTPLLLMFLFLIFHSVLPRRKILTFFILIYAAFLVVFYPIATNGNSQIRFRVTNILNVEENQNNATKLLSEDEKRGALIGGKIFHNRRLSVLNYENIRKVIENHLVHFSPEFLFVKGDVPLHHAPGFGMMYYFDALFLLLGLTAFLKKYMDRYSLILPVWLLLGPLPAAVTYQVPHAVRAEIILPTLQIISALGAIEIFKLLKKDSHTFMLAGSIFFATCFTYGVGSYMHQYYVHTNVELSRNWLYGRKEAVEYTENIKWKYNKIYVSPKIDMPYMFWLFYSAFPPEELLKEGGTKSGGFAEEGNHFDKYEFHKFIISNDKYQKNLLLVGTPDEFPLDVKTLKTIHYLDGTEAIKIVDASSL